MPSDRLPLLGVQQLGFQDIDFTPMTGQAEDIEGIELAAEQRAEQMLAKALQTRRTVAFVGSGVSLRCGYDRWDELANRVAEALVTGEDLALAKTAAGQRLRKHLIATTAKAYRRLGDRAGVEQSRDPTPCELDKRWSMPPTARGRLSPHENDELQRLKARSGRLGIVDLAALDGRLEPLGPISVFDECHELLERGRSRLGDQPTAHAVSGLQHEVAQLIEAVAEPIHSDAQAPRSATLAALISALGIRRFITTNYDMEIERALRSELNSELRFSDRNEKARAYFPGDFDDLTKAARVLSLTQDDADQLALFALGVPGDDYGVFHCHGLWTDAESMVVDSQDYQQTYFAEGSLSEAYRQAMRLAFSCNPMLFIGFSFDDEEPLRPLRYFATQRLPGTPEPPLFALMRLPESDGEPDWVKASAQRRRFYRHYGLKVLWHESSEGSSPEHRDERIGERIEALATTRHKWWYGWQAKPPARLIPHETKATLAHQKHYIERDFEDFTTTTSLAKHLGGHRDTGQFVIVFGRPGSGKGNVALDLLDPERVPGLTKELPTYGRRFYATMRFKNEYRSVIDAAAVHFDPEERYANFGLHTSSVETPPGLSPLDRAFKQDMSERIGAGESVPNIDVPSLRRLALSLVGEPSSSQRDQPMNLLVIDGFDRLLLAPSPIPSPDPREGDAAGLETQQSDQHKEEGSDALSTDHHHGKWISTDVRQLLELCRFLHGRRNARCHVVIFTSLRPMGPPGDPEADACWIRADGPAQEIVRDAFDALKTLDKAKRPELERTINALHELLNRHAFALSLARSLDASALTALLSEISSIGGTRRAERVVAFVLEHYARHGLPGDPEERKPRPATWRQVLQAVALCTTPVTLDTIELVVDQRKAPPGAPRPDFVGIIEALQDARLLTRVEASPGSGRQDREEGDRYTCHSEVRAHILNAIGSPPYTRGEPHRFIMPGYIREGEQTLPTTQRAFDQVCRSLEALLRAAESDTHGAVPRLVRRDRLRAAFSVVRARWNAAGLSRLSDLTPFSDGRQPATHYDGYQQRLVRLANALRQHGEETWTLTGRNQPDSGDPQQQVSDPSEVSKAEAKAITAEGVLYPDELAWLYNEMALVAQNQGHLYDAYALARAGQLINFMAEHGDHGRRWCQSEIGLASVMIDLGNLRRAQHHLERAASVAALKQPDLMPAIMGYRGMMLHYEGKYSESERLYGQAIDKLRRRGKHRSASVFLRLRGDLRHRLGNSAGASADLEESILRAEMGHNHDLVSYAQLSRIRLGYELEDALVQIDRILKFARDTMGMPRLEAEAYRARATLSLQVGDLVHAATAANQALAGWARLGMRMRLTQTLVLAGEIALRAGQQGRAGAILSGASVLARKETYFPEAEKAKRLLVRMGARL